MWENLLNFDIPIDLDEICSDWSNEQLLPAEPHVGGAGVIEDYSAADFDLALDLFFNNWTADHVNEQVGGEQPFYKLVSVVDKNIPKFLRREKYITLCLP